MFPAELTRKAPLGWMDGCGPHNVLSNRLIKANTKINDAKASRWEGKGEAQASATIVSGGP
jgi:hypothetical protein